MLELRTESRLNIEELAKQLYDNISKTKSVVIDGVPYRVDAVSVRKGRGIVSGWEVIIRGSQDSYDYVMRVRDERMYVNIRMKKPGIVLGIGLSSDHNHAVIIYDT